MTESTLMEILRDNYEGPPLTLWDLNRGWLPLLAKHIWVLSGHSPRALLYISSGMMLLSGLFFSLGLLRLGISRWAALLVPILLPMAPVIAFSSRRWDIHAPSLLILGLSFWALTASKHFSKWLPSLGFGLLGMAAAFFSPRETDNILLLLSLSSLGLGFWLQGLCFGAWQGEHISRLKVLSVGCFVALTVGLFVWSQIRFTSPTGAMYYLDEAGNNSSSQAQSWNHPKQLWGYLSYLFWRGWGHYIAIPAEIALIALALKKKLPWGFLFGILIPFIVLSVLPKKNFYYVSILWMYPAILIPMGVSLLPTKWRYICVPIVVFMIGRPYWARTFPESEMGVQWKQYAALPGNQNYGGILQTSDQGLPHTASLSSWPKDISERIQPLLANNACQKQWRVMLYGTLAMEELQIRLAKEFPCVDFQCDPPYTDLNNAGIVMLPDIGAAPLAEAKQKMLGQGMEMNSIVLGPDGESIYIYRRPDAWFIGRGTK